MFNEAFAKPRFRPAINIGCLMDVSTGSYETGIHGESILNGGMGSFTGICARPNNFKTALAIYMMAMVRRGFHEAHGIAYDTEGTLNPYSRLKAASRGCPHLQEIDWLEDQQFAFTDLSQFTGDTFFDMFRKTVDAKYANEKQYLRTTPFLDGAGKQRLALYPSAALIDSFSKFQVAAVQAMYEKNLIGESGANTVDMMNGKAKNQMLNQVPLLCARTGTYMVMTELLSDQINMELYPTDKRNLSYMKKDTVLKGVSGGFYSLPNNVWMITSNKPLQTKDKTPEYPWDNATAMEGDTDLVAITVVNLRGKNGLSGFPIELIVSQSEGILASLSEFHFCKEMDRFGFGGNVQNYFMELLPEVTLSRTKVRKKLAEEPKLERAVNITAELLQLHQYLRVYEPSNLLCSAKVLYEDLKAMGYNWDQILSDTRGYWVFEEDEVVHPKKFLSTMDLLKMRLGSYVPFWFSKEEKAAIKPNPNLPK